MSRPSCPGGTLYTIQAGDTFFLLSQRFNVPLNAILAANPGVDPNNLQIGQRVCIPGTTPPPPGCTGFIYVIQSGDTFFLLSQRFNVPLNAILAANPGVDPNNLQIGQRVCIPGTTPPPPPCTGFLYTVQQGDTFFLLSQRFHVPLNAIIAANPGVDPNNLQVGQRVCIPQAPAPECSGFIYTVKAGDTLFNLARQFGVTVKAIEEANPGIDPRNLAIGQKICIPKRRCPQGAFVYVVESGDTLSRIARKFNTTVQAIIKANPGIDPDDLVVGQQICVPKTS